MSERHLCTQREEGSRMHTYFFFLNFVLSSAADILYLPLMIIINTENYLMLDALNAGARP